MVYEPSLKVRVDHLVPVALFFTSMVALAIGVLSAAFRTNPFNEPLTLFCPKSDAVGLDTTIKTRSAAAAALEPLFQHLPLRVRDLTERPPIRLAVTVIPYFSW